MRLFIDECMSPDYPRRLNEGGRHDAVHPLHIGRRGQADHTVLANCIAEDRVIVTGNARDFRGLVGAVEIHPGLIVVPNLTREAVWALLEIAIAAIEAEGDWRAVMVNRVLEVDPSGRTVFHDLPNT